MDINKTKLHYSTLCVGQCPVSFWSVDGTLEMGPGGCGWGAADSLGRKQACCSLLSGLLYHLEQFLETGLCFWEEKLP